LLPLLREADGLTISGGEPFEQAGPLMKLLRALSAVQPEVLVYTGYSLAELQRHGGPIAQLLERIDILIDGPYRADLPNTLQWRGSDNQQVHLLTKRAQQYAGRENMFMPESRPLQVQMLDSTRYRIIGIPQAGDLEAYRRLMAERGLAVQGATPIAPHNLISQSPPMVDYVEKE